MADDAAAVEQYLQSVPEADRASLTRLRDHIESRYPDAIQHLRYGAPWFQLDGTPLVGIKAAKQHCALYVWSDRVIEQLGELADGFDTGESTLRFAPDAPPPDRVIDAILDARANEIRRSPS